MEIFSVLSRIWNISIQVRFISWNNAWEKKKEKQFYSIMTSVNLLVEDENGK